MEKETEKLVLHTAREVLVSQIKELIKSDLDREIAVIDSFELIEKSERISIIITKKTLERIKVLQCIDEQIEKIEEEELEREIKEGKIRILSPKEEDPLFTLGVPDPEKLSNCEYIKDFIQIKPCGDTPPNHISQNPIFSSK